MPHHSVIILVINLQFLKGEIKGAVWIFQNCHAVELYLETLACRRRGELVPLFSDKNLREEPAFLFYTKSKDKSFIRLLPFTPPVLYFVLL